MRGFRRLLLVVLVVVGAGIGIEARLLSERAAPSGAPTVDSAALLGRGDLAFITGGTLFVLDGATGAVRRVAGGAALPSYSHDGRFLAFLRNGPAGNSLWVARADGADAAAVVGLPPVANALKSGARAYAWSPTRDELAVMTSVESGARYPQALWVVDPSGTPLEVPTTGPLLGLAWSPNGDALGFAEGGGTGAHLVVDTLTSGTETTWLTAPTENLYPEAWVPHFGIVAYDDPGDGDPSIESDGLPLASVAAPGAALAHLPNSPILEPPGFAPSAEGELALVEDTTSSDGGEESARFPWSGKTLALCVVPASCIPIIGADGVITGATTVEADPSWSPNGRVLAFVEAPTETLGIPSGPPDVAPYRPIWTWTGVSWWYASRTLWLLPLGGRPVQVTKAQGVSDPTWSSDGRSILYASHNALWLLPTLTADPVEVVDALDGSAGRLAFGYADWSDEFAWSIGR